MNFYIQPNVFKQLPHLKVGVLLVLGFDNRASHCSIDTIIATQTREIQNTYRANDFSQTPKITDWHADYRYFGYKPSSRRGRLESFLHLFMEGKPLPDINPVANFYNLISIKHLLPIHGNDLDKIEGDIYLTVNQEDELLVPHAKKEREIAKLEEIIYRDDVEVLYEVWSGRQSRKTEVTDGTKNMFCVIEGLESTSLAEIAKALKELQELIETYCGGVSQPYLLDVQCPHLSPEAHLSSRTISTELSEPEYHHHASFLTRKKKLREIREMGINPYPAKYEPTHSTYLLEETFGKQPIGTFEDGIAGRTEKVRVAGRVMLFRAMGKNAFAHLQDEFGRIQIMFNRDHTEVEGLTIGTLTPLKFIEKKIDLGDIIGVEGYLFRTQKEEMTVFASRVQLLAKALLPLPDKHSGLANRGICYRKRWLDLIMNRDVMNRFKMRSEILSRIRSYFRDQGFIEVETPVLQNIFGGAEARPFVSKLNALHQTMYLRIALEIALKKLIVGGFSRVFEMGKVYRNEGIDRTHNPEFTMLEAYAAYWDYHDMMTFSENLFARVAENLYGSTCIGMRRDKAGNEHQIDLKTPWKRLSMKRAIRHYAHCDPDEMSESEMRLKLKGQGDDKELDKANRGQLIALLFDAFVEQHLIEPQHIIDYPLDISPLSKLHTDEQLRQEGFVERFETFILGYEFCNAYSELNDPELQRSIFEKQHLKREMGDAEAHPMDEEFIEAICQGMPPTAGLGIGIDRLVMLFTNAFSIRDVMYFPLMRPED